MKSRCSYIILLLICSSLCIGQYKYGYIDMGRLALQEKNYVEAIEFFNYAIKDIPGQYDGYFLRGVAKYYLDDHKGAEKDLSLAIGLLPEFPRLYLVRGLIYFDLRRFDDAINDLDKALQLDSTFYEVYYYRTHIFLELGKYQEAYDDCYKAILSGLNIPNINVIYGIVLSRLNQKEAALGIFNHALSENPNNIFALVQRGTLYSEMDSLEKALSDFNLVLDMDSTDTYALYQRGMINRKLGNNDLALNDLNDILDYNPNNEIATFNKAIIQAQGNNYKAAIRNYNNILRQNPDNLLVYINLGRSKHQVGDYSGALESFNTVIKMYPDYSEAYRLRAVTKQQIGDVAGALDDMELYEEKLELNRQKSDTTKEAESLKIKELMHLKGDFINANDLVNKPQYRKMEVKLHPPFELTLNLQSKNDLFAYTCNDCIYRELIITLRDDENETDVQKEIERLEQDIDSANLKLQLQLAIYYYQLKNRNKALEIVNEIIHEKPDELSAIFLRANINLHLIEQKQNNSSDQLLKTWLVNKVEQIQKDYNKILNRYPNFFYATYNKAYLYFLTGDYIKSQQIFQSINSQHLIASSFYNYGLLSLILYENEDGCEGLSKAGELGIMESYRIIKKYCNP